MIRPLQLLRLLQINFVLMQHTFNRPVLGSRSVTLRFLSYLNPLSFYRQGKTRGESIRLALESLGPIFVKFGQLLSTRHNLLPDDVIAELEKLQDQVPPFSTKRAIRIIEESLGDSIDKLFLRFDKEPLASASIAQVHAAQLHDGSEVIVKVLRPNINRVIDHDIALLYQVAKLTEKLWSQGKRLHPVELVSEFEQTIHDELDLAREAANASQLKRNFEHSKMMYVPKVYWDLTKTDVMVMERIYGIQISNVDALLRENTNMKKLAEYGVEIFFTQVFRDSFFHADMHPGNLFVDVKDPENPRYIGVDFGIMGSLSPSDQHYLAANMLAFFNRDYRQIAILHVESGWVPADTRVDQFEAAIRTVCEPIFERPLKQISFGQLLLRLFQTAERFQMELQPQLLLLQKTLLNIESLGRKLYPELDLWSTAKPFLEKWMKEAHSIRQLAKETLQELPETSERLIKSPRLVYDILSEINRLQRVDKYTTPVVQKPRSRRGFFLGAGIAFVVVAGVSFVTGQHHNVNAITPLQWSLLGLGGLMLWSSWITSS